MTDKITLSTMKRASRTAQPMPTTSTWRVPGDSRPGCHVSARYVMSEAMRVRR